jgi:ferritin
MLNQEIVKLLNEQLNKEFYSSYLYLHIANYYADQSLAGFENWFYIQAQEELDHALLFRKYLLNNGETVVSSDIGGEFPKYNDFREPLSVVLEHEHFITNSIHNIYEKAYKLNDFRTTQFLDWFVKEQGEEEKNSEDNLKRYDLFATDAKGLFMYDNELSTRVYTTPSLVI